MDYDKIMTDGMSPYIVDQEEKTSALRFFDGKLQQKVVIIRYDNISCTFIRVQEWREVEGQ